ncbi:hypothetical protein [Janthinobacterium sp. EB271-G4-7A]|uniref:hypothetical protein n=1 Tax=Janthinobacterium sp. EB271-G4-7A TaxID=2775056 RepID=UPI001E5438C7|nr:hypothetical protein [Janthinobacterium sp. EB271-G4-7A]MCC7696595.1 hypothetical protein [Janthinobacterium sp. EB271-G4-7A]
MRHVHTPRQRAKGGDAQPQHQHAKQVQACSSANRLRIGGGHRWHCAYGHQAKTGGKGKYLHVQDFT